MFVRISSSAHEENLADVEDVVEWCKETIKQADTTIKRGGWYISIVKMWL